MSELECTLECGSDGAPEVRLGLCMAHGLAEAEAKKLLAARMSRPFRSVEDLANRAILSDRTLAALAECGALEPLTGHRHASRWAVAGVQRFNEVLAEAKMEEKPLALPSPTEGQGISADYRSLGLTLGRHPLALLRRRLDKERVLSAEKLNRVPNGRKVRVAGIVTHRQRPGTASGVVFATLEDETGSTNLVIWPKVMEAQRDAILGSSLMMVEGELQCEQKVINVVARRIHDYSEWLGELQSISRDFH